ncbi:FAR1-related sequence 5 [Rhynchospora pubera]|uniref:Protein FAR1-RELATED SEQUENCE n=1 Tax=Rhynchospora pubera TaxID=906938 RepID=A0AAV8H624_9POAL|nr:FAR1-related sequence 5 [Rhynchospora pubera]
MVNEGASSTIVDTDPHEHLEFAPFVGKEFNTEDDAREFYNNFAYRRGFSIRKGHHYTSAKLKKVTMVQYVCSMEGFPNKPTNQSTPEKEKAYTRTGCKARFKVRLQGGVWKVSVFEDIHNHPLVTSPAKKGSLRSHRKLDYEDKEYTKDNFSGVRHGGTKNLKFKRKGAINEIASQNRKLVSMDVEAILVHFQKKQEKDPEFFYDAEVDESGRLKNMFWVDGRARRAFQEFGDVVTFDTNFKANKYSMPIAPFIGMNHHRMPIIFGIAMLRSEEKVSLIWLFQTWVKAMYDKEPRAIITNEDEDSAMRIAIKEAFPNTIHRCCQWHVMRKASDHLGAIYSIKPGFEDELKRVINRSMTVSEFEKGWRDMLRNYDLGNNRHLKVMYEKRSEWVPAYFRGVFFADMSTTHISESANSTLKLWTNDHSSMYQFVLQVEKTVGGIWANESDEDIANMKAVPELSSFHLIEKDAHQVYTSKVMSIFKGILKKTQLGEVNEVEKDALYEVAINDHPIIQNWIPETYIIKINKSEELVSCSCKRYEFEGLLCSHAIKVMHHVRMFHLPNRYIMKRWCKDANACTKRSNFERSMEFGSTQELQAIRFATLKPQVMKLLKMASRSSNAFKLFQKILDVAEQQMQEVTDKQETLICEIDTSTRIPSQVILEPPISQCKEKRKQPQRFNPQSEAKKPRRCGTCGSNKGGHNSRTCPLKKVQGRKREDDDADSEEGQDVESDGAYEYEDLSG